MSKSIYDEALLDLRMNDSMRVAGQHVLTREQYSNVFKALEQAQKQEKLLNKIKEVIDRQDDSYISSMLEESQRYYEIKELMIKEKENE